jgi:hypothetical protein
MFHDKSTTILTTTKVWSWVLAGLITQMDQLTNQLTWMLVAK